MKKIVEHSRPRTIARRIMVIGLVGFTALLLSACDFLDALAFLTRGNLATFGTAHRRLGVSATPDHAAAGSAVDVRVTWVPFNTGRGSVYVAGADGRAVEGIAAEVVANNEADDFTIRLTIAPNAPTVPLAIHATSRGQFNLPNDLDQDFVDTGEAIFYVHAAGTTDAPRITGLAPNSPRRGETTTVTLTGTGFGAPIDPVIASPGVTVTSFTTASSTEAHLTLEVAEGARTGAIPLAVRNLAGTSNTRDLFIEDRGEQFAITSFYPNHLESGTRLQIAARGRNFAAGQTITTDTPDQVHLIGSLTPRDDATSLFVASAEPAAQGLFLLNFQTLRGPFGPVGLRVLRHEVRGPRLFAIRGSRQTFPGTTTQFLLETNDRVDSSFAVESFSNLGDAVLANADIIGFRTLDENRRAVVVEVQAEDNARPGTAYLALRRPDQLTTDLASFEIALPPRAGVPFVERVIPNVVRLGQSQDVIIEGRHLGRIRSIRCRSRGLSAMVGQASTDGSFFRATFTAEQDAKITGEDVTTFEVITTQGTSNHASIIVTYSTGL
jgi:hypothetical protein